MTAIIVPLAAGAVAFKYWDYFTNPWTRDGQVRANVIQVAPRVSGPIVKLPIKDNKLVKTGDLLFEIDPRTYKAVMDEASANLDQTRDHLKDLEQQVKGAQSARPQAEAELASAKADLGKPGEENAQLRGAKAQLETAQLNLEFTEVASFRLIWGCGHSTRLSRSRVGRTCFNS